MGDRGATLNGADVTFEHDGKKYTLRRQFFTEEYGGPLDSFDSRWVNAHETVNIDAPFWGDVQTMDSESNDQEKIDCIFTLYHTHGAEKIKHISEKRREK